MAYIVIGIIILIILGAIISSIHEVIGWVGFAIIGFFILAFLAFSWTGVFVVICVVLAGFIIKVVASHIGNAVKQHDDKNIEMATINKQTQETKITNENDRALMEELENNCGWLGYMNSQMWRQKLPNYANRRYTTTFEYITMNFAKQIEQQYILQNMDWFKPYREYVVKHEGGASVTKMLNEVECEPLKRTHITPDGDLINTLLDRGTVSANKDVPPLFRKTYIEEMNEYIYVPTNYLKKLYGIEIDVSQNNNNSEEIDFNDL